MRNSGLKMESHEGLWVTTEESDRMRARKREEDVVFDHTVRSINQAPTSAGNPPFYGARLCVRCGMWNHKARDCRVDYNVVCSWCGRSGHRMQACKKLGFNEGTWEHEAVSVDQSELNAAWESIQMGHALARGARRQRNHQDH